MVKTTKKAKYRKPRPDFPLFPHATGRWAKKVRGKLVYFGKVEGDQDGQQALAKWLDQKDDLLAGRTPRPKREGLTVADLVNRFLTAKQAAVESAELAPRSFERYHQCCGRLVRWLGRDRLVQDLAPEDFEMVRRQMTAIWGPMAVGCEVQMTRILFRYGYELGLYDKPVRFGPGFKRPSAKTFRMMRAKNGVKMFEPSDIRALLDAASCNFRAMILLAINGGLGNTDLGLLATEAPDLEKGWLDYPRPKTGILRRIPLWPETVKAIRAVIAARRDPTDPEESHLLFIGPQGKSYACEHRGYRVTEEMRSLCKRVKLQRENATFYDFRRTFETIAGDSKDQVAVDYIMGHARGDMASIYRQRIDDERLVAVTNHVRTWLFGDQKQQAEEKPATPKAASQLRIVG